MENTGDNIQSGNAGWSFGGKTSEHFNRHVQRSVPLYKEGHELTLKLSDYFLNDGSICYELGCSTGTLLAGLARRSAGQKEVRFIGIDIENDMIHRCREQYKDLLSIEWQTQDILDVAFEKTDMIIAYYTVQFVKPKHRQVIIDRIYEALNWGGAFILFEKVRAPDARFQDIMTALYAEYKLDKGYTAEEMLAKSRSLKGVLEPFSTQGNLDLLQRAGFVDVMTIMKYVSFEGFLAIK
jgi:tRNA (cmo5U34)-methyltransferase